MEKHFTAADNRREGHTHVLLITTGSVASIKAPLIVKELLQVRPLNRTRISALRATWFFQVHPHLFSLTDLVATLFQYKNVSIQVAATKPSLTFFQAEDIRRQGVDIWTDDDEWDVRETLPPRDFRLRAFFFFL